MNDYPRELGPLGDPDLPSDRDVPDDAGLRDALQDCLARIEAGATLEEALSAGADVALRARIAALMAPAVGLRELPAIPAERGDAIRADLDRLAAELYPTGSAPAPPATGLPGTQLPIRLITIAAIGVGLVLIAWSTVRSGRPPPSGAVPPSPPVDARAATVGVRVPPPLVLPPTEPPPDDPGSDTAEALPATDRVDGVSTGKGAVSVPAHAGPPCADLLGVEMSADLAGTAPAAIAQAGAALVSGRVVDGDCRPVPDAVIILTTSDGTSEFLARSEPDGTFALAVQPDRYRAEILADGYGIQGWFDGRSYHAVADVDLRLGETRAPDHLDFVLSGGPTGGFP